MAWSTPITATASAVLTAAQWNASVRDNLLETPAAKATASGRFFVTTGANAIAERQFLDAVVETSESTSSSSFTSLTTDGPTVIVTTGPKAFVCISAQMSNNTASAYSLAAFSISGSTSSPADDGRAIMTQQTSSVNQDTRSGVATLMATTAGSNTFRMLYRVSGGGTSTFLRRRIQVMAL